MERALLTFDATMHLQRCRSLLLPLVLTSFAAACSEPVVEDVDLVADDVSDVPACWSADANGVARWDRPGGRQLAFVQRMSNGKTRIDLSIDGEQCRLTAGLDDDAPAFSPDGRTYAFLSKRSGELDLWVVDTRVGPTARRLACSNGHALADAPLSITTDGRIRFVSRAGDGETSAVFETSLAGDVPCAQAKRAFRAPVAFSPADVLSYVPFDADEHGAGQAEYDATLKRLLDEAVMRHGGNELAALSVDSVRQIVASPELAALATGPDAFVDRLQAALAIATSLDGIVGLAPDPAGAPSARVAVATSFGGLAVIDGFGGATPTVALRITPRDLGEQAFSAGLSWQGSKIAFSATSYQTLPRTFVWDGARQLSDEQVAQTVADRAQQWGPLGIRRIAGGLVLDHMLVGSQPSLGPAGGRGAPADGERIAFASTWVIGGPSSGSPETESRIASGNHWDVARGDDRVVALAAAAAGQSRPIFRP